MPKFGTRPCETPYSVTMVVAVKGRSADAESVTADFVTRITPVAGQSLHCGTFLSLLGLPLSDTLLILWRNDF
jgi:hypothetical protein